MNEYKLNQLRDEYDCFIGKDVCMNTNDGSIIGTLKNISNTNYIISPFSDIKYNDFGEPIYFLNEGEKHYKKSHVKGINGTNRKSIENFIKGKNNSIQSREQVDLVKIYGNHILK